jgi:hypothetical protein
MVLRFWCVWCVTTRYCQHQILNEVHCDETEGSPPDTPKAQRQYVRCVFTPMPRTPSAEGGKLPPRSIGLRLGHAQLPLTPNCQVPPPFVTRCHAVRSAARNDCTNAYSCGSARFLTFLKPRLTSEKSTESQIARTVQVALQQADHVA